MNFPALDELPIFLFECSVLRTTVLDYIRTKLLEPKLRDRERWSADILENVAFINMDSPTHLYANVESSLTLSRLKIALKAVGICVEREVRVQDVS